MIVVFFMFWYYQNMKILKNILILLTIFFLMPVDSAAQTNLKLTEEELLEMEERKIENALEGLISSNYLVFERSVFFFEQMEEKAIPILVAHLKNNKDERNVTINTIYTLGRIGESAKSATPIITSFLIDEDSDTRAVAARALGKIGSDAKDAVQILNSLQDDKSEWVKKNAMEALKKIGTKEALASLKEFKQQKAEEEKKTLEDKERQQKSF